MYKINFIQINVSYTILCIDKPNKKLTEFPVKTAGRESANGICGIGSWKWMVDRADLGLLSGDSGKQNNIKSVASDSLYSQAPFKQPTH